MAILSGVLAAPAADRTAADRKARSEIHSWRQRCPPNPGGATAGVGASYLNVEAGPEDDSTGSTGCASLSGTVTTRGPRKPITSTTRSYTWHAAMWMRLRRVRAAIWCGGLSAAKAVTATLTGPDGKFKLTGVPLGDAVPLVIQLGKWRRVVSVKVTGCADDRYPPISRGYRGTRARVTSRSPRFDRRRRLARVCLAQDGHR